MDTINILERLVSIKSNAQERANRELTLKQDMKAYILENGIEQLIVEIQNSILAEYHTTKKVMFYKEYVYRRPNNYRQSRNMA